MVLYSKTYDLCAEELRHNFNKSSGLLHFLIKETVEDAKRNYASNFLLSTYDVRIDAELGTCKITLKMG